MLLNKSSISEAEYAFKQQKHIIPLRMERGYNPDGWLGFIQGNKYFYDFTKEDTHQQKMIKLLEAILRHFGKTADGSEKESTQPTKSEQQKVRAW